VKYIVDCITQFIYNRPLIVTKRANSIRLEFPFVPSHEVANVAIILPLLTLVLGAGLIRVMMTFCIPQVISGYYFLDLENQFDLVMRIFNLIIIIALSIAFPIVFWQAFWRGILTRCILTFEASELVIGEQLLGRYYEKHRIAKQDLPPLRPNQSTIPTPETQVFYTIHRGKDVIIARWLPPMSMSTIQLIYDRYRTSSSFVEFYRDTEEIDLP
jgi:hypothetical protein